VASDHRLTPELLFFERAVGVGLKPADTGKFAELLEVVRWAPSASNKQPWRLVRSGADWHLYLERTPGYGQGALSSRLKMADLQRVDMGIAMCHLQLAAREQGLSGRWSMEKPSLDSIPLDWEYVATWLSD
jgi:nitroreductase